MRSRSREPPEFTVRTIIWATLGAAVGTVLFSLPLQATVSLALGAVLGQLLFVVAIRRFHR